MIDIAEWWPKLPADLQKRLRADPDLGLSGDDAVAVVHAGRFAVGAHWVGGDAPHFHLGEKEQQFIASLG